MNLPAIKVLVVDDDDVDLEKTLRLLRKIPLIIDVSAANSAKEAIAFLKDHIFDCVILDYRLNDADGTELIKPIQKHRTEPSPIIMVSGLGDEQIAADSIREGVFEYIPKRTLAYDKLYSALEAGLRWAKSEKELQEERARFRELADGLPQLIWTCSPDGGCDFVSNRWVSFTGIPADLQLGDGWQKQIHPEDQDSFSQEWNQTIANETFLSTRYRLRRSDNTYRLFDVSIIPHKNIHGVLTRWLGSCTDITDAENARLTQAKLATIVESSTDAIISKDILGFVTSWNNAAELLFGYTAAEAIGKKVIDLIIPSDKIDEEISIMKRLKQGEKIKSFETIRRNKDGRRLPVSITFSAILSTDQKLLGFSKIARNISDKIAVESALLVSEERFRATFDSAPVGMALISLNGNFLEANRALQELLNCEFNQLRQLNQTEITHTDDRELEKKALQGLSLHKNLPVKFEKRIYTVLGQEIPVLTSVAMLYKDDLPDSYLYQYIDLSERKKYELKLLQLAHFDPLTGLANRTKFNTDIEHLLCNAKRNAIPFAVLFGDLDHFKHINDSLGHNAGDDLLKTIAERLRSVLRQGDTVARLGGDEFVILLSSATNFEMVAGVAQKLMAVVEEPIYLKDQCLHIGMSFGIALYPTDGENAATLLRNADSALYEAKSKGRGCYSLYRQELTRLVEIRLKLDADLRRALERGEFELHFQPVICLETNHVISAEALIRWRHPEAGMIQPNDFIPYAQESGLILPMGEWILHEACRIANSWKSSGYDLAVAVNISSRQFKDNSLLSIIQRALALSQLDASMLHLEITEQLLLEDTENNLAQLDSLKHAGMKIYLDDFGIGYSSLSYIIRFFPHYLKIDRSFIQKIGSATEHDAMVEAIIGLSKVLPMQIIAEGVENELQHKFLKQRGCNHAQGFLFSKPLPEKEFLQFLHQRESHLVYAAK